MMTTTDIWVIVCQDSDGNEVLAGAYTSFEEAKKKMLAIRKEYSAEFKIECDFETSFFVSNEESCYIESTVLHS